MSQNYISRYLLLILIVIILIVWFTLNQINSSNNINNVTLFAYEKDGMHIFDGAVIAAIDTSTGKIVAEQTAGHDGKAKFSLPAGSYRFQPSPKNENRVVGSLEKNIQNSQEFILLLTEVGPDDFGEPVDTCEGKYDAVEGIFETANYCVTNDDCKAIPLGGEYIEFGCWKYVYKGYNTDILYQRMDQYVNSCAKAINECAPSPNAVCRTGRCIFND